MTRRKVEYKRPSLYMMQVTGFAWKFLNDYKYRGNYIEPFYRALDRLINNYNFSDTAKLEEKIKGLEAANERLMQQIYELKKDKQIKLVSK